MNSEAQTDGLAEAIQTRIKRQVEFYFSDSNAPRDKFLMEHIKSHPEGYVEIALICSFKRMSAALSLPANQAPEEISNAIIQQVAEVLRTSEQLVVSEDGEFVRRKLPIASTEEMIKAMDERSLYAAPFPYDATLDGLTAFFREVAPINCVRMRRHLQSKDFKGSVFVEFVDKDTAEMALGKKIEFEGAQLRLERKVEFVARKVAERKERLNVQQVDMAVEGSEQKIDDAVAEHSQPAADGSEDAQVGPSTPPYTPGLVLRFKIAGDQELLDDMNFISVKDALGGREAGIIFVEYFKGERTGVIRLAGLQNVKDILAKQAEDGTIAVCNVKVELSGLEGDAERDFYARSKEKSERKSSDMAPLIQAAAARQAAEANKKPGGGDFLVNRSAGHKRKGDFGRGGWRGSRGRFGKRGRTF